MAASRTWDLQGRSRLSALEDEVKLADKGVMGFGGAVPTYAQCAPASKHQGRGVYGGFGLGLAAVHMRARARMNEYVHAIGAPFSLRDLSTIFGAN